MLILKRKINEAIKIDRKITIKILEISENQVKIGIEAPREIEILRSELLEDIKENLISARLSVQDVPENLNKFNINKLGKDGK